MRSGRVSSRTLRCTVLLLAAMVLAAAVRAAPEPAEIMPRAAASLLVDIVRAGERLVAVGDYGHILYSDDSGRSWTQVPVPVRVLLTAVFFVDARHGWAVGHDGMIVATGDGGLTWRLQRDGLDAQQRRNEAGLERARSELAALEREAAADAGLLEEARALLAEAEERLAEPVFPPPLMDVFFTDQQHGLAVGAYGTFLRTDDGGASWVDADAASIDNPDELHYYAIASDGDARLLLAGEAGSLYRSADRGASWETLGSPYEGTLFGALGLPGTATVGVFGLQGNVHVSRDFGDSWTPLDSGVETVLAGGTLSGGDEVLLVGSMGTMLAVRLETGVVTDHTRVAMRQQLGAAAIAPDGTLVVAGQGGVRRIEGVGVGNARQGG